MKYLDKRRSICEDTGKQEVFCFILYAGFFDWNLVCQHCVEGLHNKHGNLQRFLFEPVCRDGYRDGRICLVYHTDTDDAGHPALCTGMYEDQERGRRGVPALDRLFLRYDNDVRNHEDGNQGDRIMPACYDSAVCILHRRIRRAALALVFLSGI